MEVRRSDGNPYPATTIVNLLSDLHRHAKTTSVEYPNFMDHKNSRFRESTGAMQARFRELRKTGIGGFVKHVPIVTPEEEDRLWSSQIMGVHSPFSTAESSVLLCWKNFLCLRGAEHRDLKISQFVRSEQPDSYNYIENGSKNITGVSTKIANKVVPVYSSPEAHPRCLVYLLDLYLSKLPPKAIQLDLFYLRPKKSAESGSWYDCVAVGKEKLRNFLQSMCADAGISEKKTNHSLRATGASALFNAGVPERFIRDVTISPQNFIVNATPMPAQSTEVDTTDLLQT